MRIISILIITLIFSNLSGQNNPAKHLPTKVIYHNYSNGKIDINSQISTIFDNGIVYLSEPDSKIKNYIDYNTNHNLTIIDYNEITYLTSVSLDSMTKPKFENEIDSILGFACKKASFLVFSNNIEIWYTEESKIKGSPYRNYLPTKEALVLKIVVNGNRTIIADSIISLNDYEPIKISYENIKEISDSEFEEIKIKSRYTVIPIFNNETINFDPDYWKENEFDTITGVYHFSKGAVVMKKIELPDQVKKGAIVFARLTAHSAGDAYDRTGSVFIIDQKNNKLSMYDAMCDGLEVLPIYYDNNEKQYQGIVSTSIYDPPIEIMRFFTSFGVGHFNSLREINNYSWENNATYKQDVTNTFPTNTDSVWIGVFIGNYDKGGHKVSLELDIYPSFNEDKINKKYIQPLFNTVNIMEMSNQEYGRLFNNDTLLIDFSIVDSLQNLNLLYTSTGHGGWGGGDEFNPKLNQIFMDGELIYSGIPWRTDCATYRLYNPASGNFSNGMSSSDLSRSNWCPATLTPPYLIKLDQLDIGNHKIEVVIDQGKDEGGSFNHWSVSGILVGEYK